MDNILQQAAAIAASAEQRLDLLATDPITLLEYASTLRAMAAMLENIAMSEVSYE